MSTSKPLISISSILPKLSLPNRKSAPTNDESKTGLISESKIRSSRYSPLSLHMTIPFIDSLIFEILFLFFKFIIQIIF